MIMTIGHSTLKPEEFIKLIRHHKIDAIWDVRSHPGSTNCPHFNRDAMHSWCPIPCEWVPALGGWNSSHAEWANEFNKYDVDVLCYCHRHFPKQRIAAERKHAADEVSWWNQGLYDYSWFTALPEFMRAAHDLIKFAQINNIAIMCSEAQWWRCHRSMVADYLCFTGNDAAHVMGKRLTLHSRVISDRLDRYDPRIRVEWSKNSAAT